MNSLQIGKAIYQILNSNGISKVFPIIADEGTTFPFVVYRRIGLTPASTKDVYNFRELATMEIVVASSDYESGIDLAITIKDLLEHTRGIYNDIKIGDIKVMGATEDYIEDTFVQKLTLNIEILWQ